MCSIAVEATLKVLATDGTVQRLAMQWFGEDRERAFQSDINALEKGRRAASRTLLLGADTDVFPMSYEEKLRQLRRL